MYTIHNAIEAGIISNTKNENSISYTSYVIYPSFSLLYSLSFSSTCHFPSLSIVALSTVKVICYLPSLLVHPFFLLPPTPRRSLAAAREYGIEGRIITEKKKMNANRTRGSVKFTTCCTNDDSRCVGFWNIYRDELFLPGRITRALWKMIRFTFWGKIVNAVC